MTFSNGNVTSGVLNFFVALAIMAAAVTPKPCFAEGFTTLEKDFREVPPSARRLTGPLFWLHGDERETRERLEFYIGKIAEGHNGSFCAESRPHSDWLGPRWYEDLAICLDAAKKNDLHMWIFDERWWPSQTVANNVPERYRSKRLVAETVEVEGPEAFEAEGYGGDHFVAAIAGRATSDGIDPDSLVDLESHISDGVLKWQAPEGEWQVMRFTWTPAPPTQQARHHSVDGASQDCVDWFIETVYQPHYARFKEDFGKTIVGFFYDEPETQGDWGTELAATFAERGVDWKKAFVAYKFELAGGRAGGGAVRLPRRVLRDLGPHDVRRHDPLVRRARRAVDRSLHGTRRPLPGPRSGGGEPDADAEILQHGRHGSGLSSVLPGRSQP
jgi:hypothetical protein